MSPYRPRSEAFGVGTSPGAICCAAAWIINVMYIERIRQMRVFMFIVCNVF